MSWFKKWLGNLCVSAMRDSSESQKNYLYNDMLPSPSPGGRDTAVLSFEIYSAVGGQIVEFRRTDKNTDRTKFTRYIISDDQDIGDRISKIVTMEALKS